MTASIQNISLYIPHIYSNYSKKDVGDIFENLKIGKINYIDFISKMGKDGKEYNSAYIHFDYWYNNKVTSSFQERVLNPEKEARLVYEDPWYWIVLENKTIKVNPGQRKTRINLGVLNAISNKKEVVCPSTPIKLVKEKNIQYNIKPSNLMQNFDVCTEENEIELAMEECENYIKEDDQYLAYFDKRYVETIEKENNLFRTQILQIQNAYLAEQMKSATLADYIQKLNKE